MKFLKQYKNIILKVFILLKSLTINKIICAKAMG